jgi:hypothetical protein
VAKKNVVVVAASVSSMKAIPTAGLALELEEPTAAVACIPGRKVGEECWNSYLDGRLEAVAGSIQLEAAIVATSKATWLRVVGPYENPIA